MPAADLSPYLQPSGTGADGTKFDNALNYLQTLINGLDQNNFAAGKILDPLKLMQDGAVDGDGLVWSTAANGGTGGWVPSTTRKMLRSGLARDITIASRSAVLSVNNTTLSAVPFDTEIVDDSSQHSTVTTTTRITFADAGVRIVGAHALWAVNGTLGRYAAIYLNGVTLIASNDAPSQNAGQSSGDSALSVAWPFAANDYIELFVYQNSGAAVNLSAASFLWAARI